MFAEKAKNYQFTEITAGKWTFTLKHTSDERQHALRDQLSGAECSV